LHWLRVSVCATSGEFFGELALITNDRRSATVRASLAGPLEVFTLFKHDFVDVIESFPKLKEVISQVSEAYDA
jgi:CRP-like cAMP-binding protein